MALKGTKEYLHFYSDSTLGELEKERLRLLNTAYGPEAWKVLGNHLKPGMTVLELGVGTGEIGSWLAAQVGQDGKYIGIDKDSSQLEKSKRVITGSHVELIQADVLSLDNSSEFLASKPKEGFNLIYCRWLLCHITETHRVDLIGKILSLLAVGGVFICEEPDYRGMHLNFKGEPIEDIAIDKWKEIVMGLEAKASLGLDLKMDGSKLLMELAKVASDATGYNAEIITSFQPKLQGDQKYALVYGIETAKKAILSTGKTEEELKVLVGQLKQIANNPDNSIVFYTNTFVKVTKLPSLKVEMATESLKL